MLFEILGSFFFEILAQLTGILLSTLVEGGWKERIDALREQAQIYQPEAPVPEDVVRLD